MASGLCLIRTCPLALETPRGSDPITLGRRASTQGEFDSWWLFGRVFFLLHTFWSGWVVVYLQHLPRLTCREDEATGKAPVVLCL